MRLLMTVIFGHRKIFIFRDNNLVTKIIICGAFFVLFGLFLNQYMREGKMKENFFF